MKRSKLKIVKFRTDDYYYDYAAVWQSVRKNAFYLSPTTKFLYRNFHLVWPKNCSDICGRQKTASDKNWR